MSGEQNLIKEDEYKGYNIKIYYDEYTDNPRDEEYDNICKIHIAHRRYDFGDVNHNSRESIEEAEQKAIKNKDIVLPLYMYDHSGITISLESFWGKIPNLYAHFDSCQVGMVIIPRKKILEEFSAKKWSKKLEEKALEIAKSEVKTLDFYITGQVYYFVIEDSDGEEIDSCGGYIGYMEDMENEIKSIIDSIEEKVKVE